MSQTDKNPIISKEFAEMGLEEVLAEDRYDVFRRGRLVASISSIPGALELAGFYRPPPFNFTHASGQCFLAHYNGPLIRTFRGCKSFDALVRTLERDGYRLEQGALRALGVL